MNGTLLFVIVIACFLIIAWVVFEKRKREKHTHLLTQLTPHNKCPLTFHINSLRPCASDDDCGACEENGPRNCVTVTKDSPYEYELRDNKKVSVPFGKWCIPPKATSVACNPMTGNPVLVKRGHDHVWRCQCKYPKLVDNAGVFGDCSEVAACGAKLVGSTNTLICPPNSEACTPGQPWSENPTWDPSAAICRCGPGQLYIERGETKLCVEDPCFPGSSTSPLSEKCACPAPITDGEGNKISYVALNGRCIKDPCNPKGYFNGKTCVCVHPKSVARIDPLSPVEWSCASPCDANNNPCGDRGKCVLNEEGRAVCSDCAFPNYQSDDKLCNNIVKHQYARCSNDKECESGKCGRNCKTSGWGWVKHPVCCPTNFGKHVQRFN